jgi:hypothetical protein
MGFWNKRVKQNKQIVGHTANQPGKSQAHTRKRIQSTTGQQLGHA